jgi:hypothetical protein
LLQQLSGRLGNQLFQWGFAHRLANHYGVKVKLFMDSSHANGFTGDDLFSHLPICEHIHSVTRKDIVGFGIKGLDKALTLSSTLTTQFEIKFGLLRTKNSYMIPELPNYKPNLITGFFINSRSVEFVEDIILPELENLIKSINAPENLPERYQYIHIRRGDYVTSATSHGLIGAAHYRKFVQKALPLIIGTDDVKSSESIIEELRPAFVFSPRNSNAWQALKMMAMSDSLVLANSTLSWWGGFLASNRGKMVLSPSPFYKNDLESDERMQYKKFTKVTSEFL